MGLPSAGEELGPKPAEEARPKLAPRQSPRDANQESAHESEQGLDSGAHSGIASAAAPPLGALPEAIPATAARTIPGVTPAPLLVAIPERTPATAAPAMLVGAPAQFLAATLQGALAATALAIPGGPPAPPPPPSHTVQAVAGAVSIVDRLKLFGVATALSGISPRLESLERESGVVASGIFLDERCSALEAMLRGAG